MRERKNTVLLFSKVPEVGLVKTRLSILKDGMFPPETAARFYECMLFDVAEIICTALRDLENEAALATHNTMPPVARERETAETQDAGSNDAQSAGSLDAWEAEARGVGNLDAREAEAHDTEAPDARIADLPAAMPDDVVDTYEFVISTTPAANVPVMQKLFEDAGPWPHELVFIADEGATFDEHYNHAFAQCWERGADCILSMGADMPALTKADVRFGFEQLHQLDGVPGGGIVLAPDQEMGVSVIGWTRDTNFDHAGVYYNQDGLTVLPAYIQKARAAGLPALWLPPIPDIDTMQDFFHNVTLVHALCYCADYDDICPPWRTAEAFIEEGFREVRVAPNDLRDPREHIDQG